MDVEMSAKGAHQMMVPISDLSFGETQQPHQVSVVAH
jgi:hypothetical protein